MKRGFEAWRRWRDRPVWMAMLALAACGAARAQPAAAATPPMAAPAPAAVFAIRGFEVEGENPLDAALTQRLLAPYVRADATLATLQQAASALEQALRERGFGLYRVALPPQEVGATVKLAIVRFTMGKVDFQGRERYDEENILRSLPELREGRSPNLKRLAVQAAIVNENPNKQVQVALRESQEQDRIDATVTVREQRPWSYGVSLSNAGSESTGRDRLTLTAGHTNLFNRDHQFAGAYTTSLARADDVKQLGLSYRLPLYDAGGVVGASFTRSDVVGDFGAFRSTGAGHTAGLHYTHYLDPEGGRRSYLSLGLDDRLFEAARIDDQVVAGALDRRSRPLVLGYTARTESDTAAWGYNIELAVNTGAGARNDLASYRSEDPRIDRLHWRALRGGAIWSAGSASTWLWTARVLWQYSPDVLISGEQFGLGGHGSVRGTRLERPIAADKGLSAALEALTPEVASGVRLLGFLDAGWLGNNRPDGAVKPRSDRLASLGVGARYAAGPVALSLDYGRIVQGSRVPLALHPGAPKRGDDRLYVSATLRF